MLLLMKAGDRLEKHSAPGPITVSVRGGSNRFATPDETVGADAREDFACDAGVRHPVEALEAAAYLIGPATGGEQSRTRSSAEGRGLPRACVLR